MEIDPRHWNWGALAPATYGITQRLFGSGGPVDRVVTSDDVDAFLYYGQYGLADPTNVADYSGWRSVGSSRRFALSAMIVRAFVGGAVIGWIFDPKDMRSGWDLDVDMFAPPVTYYGF